MKRKLTKEEVNRYLSEIYTLLYLGHYQTKFKKKLPDDVWGLYDPNADENNDGILWISTRAKNYLLNTLIHECLHAIYPNYSESKVCWLTTQILKRLSPSQYAHLIIAWAENLKRHYRFRLI